MTSPARLLVPVVAPGVFFAASQRGWLEDTSWILLFSALLLAPALLASRRRRDAFSVALLLVTGAIGFTLSGLVAFAVLLPAWLLAMFVSCHLLEAGLEVAAEAA